MTKVSWGGGTGGSEPPASRTLLSRFPYLYVAPPALIRAAPVPFKLAESKHILKRWFYGRAQKPLKFCSEERVFEGFAFFV